MNQKSGWAALLLSVIPGLGHLYLDKYLRGICYLMLFFLPIGMGVVLGALSFDDVPFHLGILFAAVIWVINKFDILFTYAAYREEKRMLMMAEAGIPIERDWLKDKEERTYVLLWSLLLPGLGHLVLGLTLRGLTFLISFFGAGAMILFIMFVTGEVGFGVFLVILPVIWVYALFDAMTMVQRKQEGLGLVDRSVLDELAEKRSNGRKSKVATLLLSLLPGAGHMYLGLQKRGLQLMAAFLLSVYVLDLLRLSIFLIAIPLIWFYSLFDALQAINRYEEWGELRDVPIVEWRSRNQKWLGLGLIFFGGYYLLDRIVIKFLARVFDQLPLQFWYSQYFQTVLVAVVLIVIGVVLLVGSNRRDV